MTAEDPLLHLLRRFHQEGVEYVLSEELNADWFLPPDEGTFENIRVADDLLIDLLFSANGETYESVQPHIRELTIEGTPIRVLNIDGLIKTKTDYREKDLLDKRVLARIKDGLMD